MMDFDRPAIRVLLVEDDLSDATLLRTLLEQEERVGVTLAQDGIRGSELAKNESWDLVVTDINLPGQDGIDVIRTVKKHQPGVPVIAISAYSAGRYQESALRNGADEVLVKPIDRDDLLTTARNLLEAKAAADRRPGKILALGAYPGDVEAGCGGTLLKHVAAGEEVHLAVAALDAQEDERDQREEEARKAAEILGVRLILPDDHEPGHPDLDTLILRVEDLLQEVDPRLVYVPSVHDTREFRRELHRAADISTSGIPELRCFPCATTTLDFHPTHFEDIAGVLDDKMASLSPYQAVRKGRPHLDPELAWARARHWGSFRNYGKAEPLEIIRRRR